MKKIGQEFIDRTKDEEPPDQMLDLPQPLLELEYDKAKILIDLPKPEQIELADIGLRKAIENRRSIRHYSEASLTMEELSYLLWCTQGVKKIVPGSYTLRTVPSAGARHALETYLLVNNIQGLRRGIYRFLSTGHKLVEISTELNLADKITAACIDQEFVKMSAVTFIWVAVTYRMTWRYTERGYRYICMEAGHVCQNLYLSAESINCGVCAIGAFVDDDINKLLHIDGESQFVIYIATLGKK